jgi:predicted nucleic acid-binding protein
MSALLRGSELRFLLETNASKRRDPAQGAVLRAWLDEQVLPTFKFSVLAFDATAARICGRLQVPEPRPFRDCMIAATAVAHSATLVTRNVKA